MDDKSVSLKVQSTKFSTSDESYDQLDHETDEARDHNVSDVDTIPNQFFNLNNISEDFTREYKDRQYYHRKPSASPFPEFSAECKRCGYKYSLRNSMQGHKHRKHVGPKDMIPQCGYISSDCDFSEKLLCFMCGKELSTLNSLWRHIIRKHIKLKLNIEHRVDMGSQCV